MTTPRDGVPVIPGQTEVDLPESRVEIPTEGYGVGPVVVEVACGQRVVINRALDGQTVLVLDYEPAEALAVLLASRAAEARADWP